MEATKCPLIVGKAPDEERQICLNCPLPQCVLEIPGSCPAKEIRNMQIRELARQGKAEEELATLFNVSKRTIQRCNTTYGGKDFMILKPDHNM